VKLFQKYGLSHKVIFYRPIKPSSKEIEQIRQPITRAIWNSHLTATKFGRQNLKANRLLILEDDLVFESFFTPQLLDDARRGLEKLDASVNNQLMKNWDIYYLGHNPFLWGAHPP
jgi:hypothetical protein